MNNYTPCPWSKGIVRMTIFVLFALMAGIAIITILYFTAENLDNSDKNQLIFWNDNFIFNFFVFHNILLSSYIKKTSPAVIE